MLRPELFDKIQELKAEAAHKAAAAMRCTIACSLVWSLQAGLASEFAAYLTALNDSDTYRTEILPRAEEAYRLCLTRYREMATAYPQVLIAQRTLFELSTRYLQSVEEGWQAALRIQGFLAGDGLQSPRGADAGGDGMVSVFRNVGTLS